MSGSKCRNCGSTDIETDPARGDAVCTQCGFVLEDQLIVSETTFEEAPSGNMMVLGQFVANDSTGGATGFGAAYHVNGKESREITIQNAKKGITHLCMQLHLNQHCIDTSVNFYKMALSRNLTRGRKQAHNHAACVYITCRTEGTAHMLIDISDVLQICVHELGRTYLRFTQALCINIPSMVLSPLKKFHFKKTVNPVVEATHSDEWLYGIKLTHQMKEAKAIKTTCQSLKADDEKSFNEFRHRESGRARLPSTDRRVDIRGNNSCASSRGYRIGWLTRIQTRSSILERVVEEVEEVRDVVERLSSLSEDHFILNCVMGYKISFEEAPRECGLISGHSNSLQRSHN